MTRASDETFFKNPQVASIAAAIDAVMSLMLWIFSGGTWQFLARMMAMIGWFLLIGAAVSTDQVLFNENMIWLESSRQALRIMSTGAALVGVSAPWWMPRLLALSR